MIYGMIFPTPIMHVHGRVLHNSILERYRPNLNDVRIYRRLIYLLHICRQIRAEFIDAFFPRKNFIIASTLLQQFFERIPEDARSRIAFIEYRDIDTIYDIVDFPGSNARWPVYPYKVYKTRQAKKEQNPTGQMLSRLRLNAAMSPAMSAIRAQALTEAFPALNNLVLIFNLDLGCTPECNEQEFSRLVYVRPLDDILKLPQLQWIMKNSGLERFKMKHVFMCDYCKANGTGLAKLNKIATRIRDAVTQRDEAHGEVAESEVLELTDIEIMRDNW